MTLFQAFGQFAGSGAVAAGAPGMVLVTPSSISHTGTSATIGANGQVTFSAVTELSLNGIFSADFDNYLISLRGTTTGGNSYAYRLRAAGSDNSTASSYDYQRIEASSTIIQSARTTTDKANLAADLVSTTAYGFNAYFYGPFVAEPTSARSTTVTNANGAVFEDFSSTHNQSTSYDGLTLLIQASSTGALQVYGIRS